jgi:L-ascorbate metabolism protein UlaG (beta-lactamase superfamily)
MKELINKIHWYGQAAVMIDAPGCKIYIDPYQLKHTDKADVILITHTHYDHFSEEDIKKVVTQNTIFIAPADCNYKGACKQKLTLLPGHFYKAGSVDIEAVPAYNVVKTNKHPKSNNWVGYIINVNGVKVYHAGDTERTPEMKTTSCDIVMLPLGQTYTMNTINEAVEAVIDLGAKIAIPIHYGLYEGKDEDAITFKNLLKDKVEVIIMPRE